MNSYKMISAALLAGLMTACVITDGSTDSATGGGSTAGSTGGTGTDGGTGTGSSGGTGTGTGTDGTGTSSDVPTTDAPTSSTSVSSSTAGTGSSTGGGGAMCGWDPGNMYYDCGFEGEDPNGMIPIACPDGLVEGDPCGPVPGEGCCDGNGDNWYCGDNGGEQLLVKTPCG